MQPSRNWTPGAPLRRLVLGVALAAGLAVALLPDATSVSAADLATARIVAQTISPVDKAAAPEAPSAPKSPTSTAAPDKGGGTGAAENAETDSGKAAGADAAGKSAGIIIQKGDKHVRIQGLGSDREYDSFEQFVRQAPWLAFLVFMTVLLVFLVPLLIIVLLIWYKIRKNRLANETMLKLAERGVVPPAAAMEAVATGSTSSLASAGAALSAAAPPGAPAYEHARFLHRRVVWSDLRKGVILTAIGLGLTLYSMLDDGSPNGLGLVFVFVGLGYCVLWFFEDRNTAPRDMPPPPAGGA